MTDPSWKKFERRVARWFGCEREPGSGSHRTEENERTGSDSQHPRLFIDGKHTRPSAKRQPAVVTEWLKVREKARKEGKIPVLANKAAGMTGALLTIHSDDLLAVAAERERAMQDYAAGVRE